MGKLMNKNARKKQDGRDYANDDVGGCSEAGNDHGEIALGKAPRHKAEYNEPCIIQRYLDAKNLK